MPGTTYWIVTLSLRCTSSGFIRSAVRNAAPRRTARRAARPTTSARERDRLAGQVRLRAAFDRDVGHPHHIAARERARHRRDLDGLDRKPGITPGAALATAIADLEGEVEAA